MLTQQKQEMAETITLNRCCACTAELQDRDKFCRRCGIRQVNNYVTSTELGQSFQCETAPLTANLKEFTSYSGELIRIVTQSMSTKATRQVSSRSGRRLICTLITIPIWMLIVMLSPLDAFAAAKAAAGCMEQR